MKRQLDELSEREVEAVVQRAAGRFLPTTEAEVRRAEEEGVEFDGELPEGLADFRPRASREAGSDASSRSAPANEAPTQSRNGGEVVSLGERRAQVEKDRSRFAPWVTHAAFGALCAAAAAAVVFFARRGDPDVHGAGRDPSETPATAAASSTPAPLPAPIIRVDASPACAVPLTDCPSGRACAPGSIAEIGEGRYRLRVGDFAPTELGKVALERGPIDVCARVGSSEVACRPARVGEASSLIVLPLTFTGNEGLAGVTVDVRYRGAAVPLGTWSGPLGLSAKGLCNGQLVEPAQAGGDKLGTVSLFADDATYVEVGRAATTQEVDALRARFETPLDLRLFETVTAGPGKFALAFGPFGAAEAERVRWAVNDGGGQATVSLGADYVGNARPAK